MLQRVLQRGWGGSTRKAVACVTDVSGDNFRMFQPSFFHFVLYSKFTESQSTAVYCSSLFSHLHEPCSCGAVLGHESANRSFVKSCRAATSSLEITGPSSPSRSEYVPPAQQVSVQTAEGR